MRSIWCSFSELDKVGFSPGGTGISGKTTQIQTVVKISHYLPCARSLKCYELLQRLGTVVYYLLIEEIGSSHTIIGNRNTGFFIFYKGISQESFFWCKDWNVWCPQPGQVGLIINGRISQWFCKILNLHHLVVNANHKDICLSQCQYFKLHLDLNR